MISIFSSPVAIFHVVSHIAKGALSGLTVPGFRIGFTTPITLQPNDRVWLDVRSGVLHTVERDGIVIWRKDWVN